MEFFEDFENLENFYKRIDFLTDNYRLKLLPNKQEYNIGKKIMEIINGILPFFNCNVKKGKMTEMKLILFIREKVKQNILKKTGKNIVYIGMFDIRVL